MAQHPSDLQGKIRTSRWAMWGHVVLTTCLCRSVISRLLALSFLYLQPTPVIAAVAPLVCNAFLPVLAGSLSSERVLAVCIPLIIMITFIPPC